MKTDKLKNFIRSIVIQEVKRVLKPTFFKIIESSAFERKVNSIISEQLNYKLMSVLLEKKSINSSYKDVFNSSQKKESHQDDFIDAMEQKERQKKEEFKKRAESMIFDENSQNIFGDLLEEGAGELTSPSAQSLMSSPTVSSDGVPVDSDDEGVDLGLFGF